MDLVSLLNAFQKIALVFVFWKVRISFGRLEDCIAFQWSQSDQLCYLRWPTQRAVTLVTENIKLEQNIYVQFM